MKRTSVLRKFVKTRMALADTVQMILNLNRKRKIFSTMPEVRSKVDLDEELRVLNATADNQARALRRYEAELNRERRA